jgi:uncharacterized protein (UPF0276 family)
VTSHAASRRAGLGLRRALLPAFDDQALARVDFLELAPENWLGVGGVTGRSLRRLAERTPLVAHGLSLNLGGYMPLDRGFLDRLRRFLDEFSIDTYSEHLSACGDAGYLHDLIPIPFTTASLHHVSTRLDQVQEALQRPVTLENVSAYAQWPGDFDEAGFLTELVQRTGCRLLLDINNVWVNSRNQGYDPQRLIQALPAGSVAAYHLAGHAIRDDGLLIDTHGEAVCADVLDLYRHALSVHGDQPVVLERDFHLPPLPMLLDELDTLRAILPQHAAPEHEASRT